MDFQKLVNNYYENKKINNNNYTYEQAVIDVKQKLKDRNNKKILEFNKNIEYTYDLNGFPKLIHFTLKNKNNIENAVWRDCLNAYIKMYPDYKIIIYDDNDIYKIINFFNKKHIDFVKNIKKGAILADVFRYLILYLRGGYYSDMDCFPHKRIDRLVDQQFHGDLNNNIYIYNINQYLPDKGYCFYENPCENCKLIHSNTNIGVGINNIPKHVYKCEGHYYVNNKTSIIVCYEYDKTWHNGLVNGNNKGLWVNKGVGICQWFIGAKPQEKVFMTCYKKSLKNTINNDFNNNSNYHFNVINSTGPLFFTRMINSFIEKDINFKDKICILPADYFCCGSGTTVPSTKNKFIQHKFTGSWLK